MARILGSPADDGGVRWFAVIAIVPDRDELAQHGISVRGDVHWHPTTSQLYEHALARGDARLAEGGPLVVDTGEHTGRSPKDKFVVREPGSEERIWWGDVNAEISEEHFDGLRDKVADAPGEGDVYVIDAFAGADPAHRIAVRVSRRARGTRSSRRRSSSPDGRGARRIEPQALFSTRLRVGGSREDGTRTETFIVPPSVADRGRDRRDVLRGRDQEVDLHRDERPAAAEGVFPMHCSANLDEEGRVAVFFGLSGTGKTTLSADPERRLIGDDEHGWSDEGVFNVEGGCYAKVIRLSAEAEPEIYATTRAFGTMLENVVVDERGILDLDDDSKTENTRAAYELEQIPNALPRRWRAIRPTSSSSPPTRSGSSRRSRG